MTRRRDRNYRGSRLRCVLAALMVQAIHRSTDVNERAGCLHLAQVSSDQGLKLGLSSIEIDGAVKKVRTLLDLVIRRAH